MQTKTQQKIADRWNQKHRVGTRVRYWTGVREGEGRISVTRTQAIVLMGHTAVVWLKDVAGCVALSHVEPAPELPDDCDC